ncbi:hypothetical protein [Paenibacillus sp. MMS18-CY102]|uniref:hypothetical protein n=1 Tax=Paenibacillus sp. MMS18-CY102 TaxID=2682849 RepID=UPI001365E8F4|nr:hypothetical protein [Paenibacillus sp. MMS18-CY102]MWC31233.1 hypothetical protein [Paenibacillus sp. MMS18-CY102]
MINEVETIELQHVSLSCKPKRMHFKPVKEQLRLFSHVFTQGKTYAIVGEQGRGGGALSYLLSGKVQTKSGNILINNKINEAHVFQPIGWYVGEDGKSSFASRLGMKKQKTIREQLENAPPGNYSTEQLITLFGLSASRLEREINYISNERWNASTAIGLAYGKRIFCFPWLEDDMKGIIRARLKLCSSILKQNKSILIIPVQSDSIVEQFVDEIVYID